MKENDNLISTNDISLLEVKLYKKGDYLFKQNDDGTDLYLLNKGKIDIYVDDQFIDSISKPGSIIGESAALFKHKRSTTAKFAEDSEVIVLPGEYIDRVVMEKPDIGLNLLKTVIERLHSANKQIVRLEKIIGEYKEEINKIKGENIKSREYRLGELFYNAGIITKEQLEEALKLQNSYEEKGINKPIGRILIEKGFATTFQVLQVMRLQKMLSAEELS